MEGIPAQDLKDHEKQKNGNKSESDDDEPSVKKSKLEQPIATGMPPQMVMPNMIPNMAQFPMMMQRESCATSRLAISLISWRLLLAGFPMMPGMMIPPGMMMGHRPMFPSAVPTSAAQQKPTFPAYSNATISAPPTVATSGATTSVNETQKPPTIPQAAGTASKIIHPPEDTSLEELRARKPQYKLNKMTASSPHSSSSTPTSLASSQKFNESKMVQAAQEVSQLFAFHAFVSFHFICLSLIDVCE